MRKNNQIRAVQVRLIDSEGQNLGVVNFQDALKQAREQNLDLVEVNPKASPVIVKIADYGKMMYEEKKKASIAKKNQKAQEMKELTLRPRTDENDLKHKVEQAKEFLINGNKVKFTVKFRGREITHPQIGKDQIDWIIKELSPLIISNPPVSLEGKIMSVIVSPLKQKVN